MGRYLGVALTFALVQVTTPEDASQESHFTGRSNTNFPLADLCATKNIASPSGASLAFGASTHSLPLYMSNSYTSLGI